MKKTIDLIKDLILSILLLKQRGNTTQSLMLSLIEESKQNIIGMKSNITSTW